MWYRLYTPVILFIAYNERQNLCMDFASLDRELLDCVLWTSITLECQGTPCSKQVQYLKVKQVQQDSDSQLFSLYTAQSFGLFGQMVEC